jgi:transcriptional regulator with XRE-family HTH domain
MARPSTRKKDAASIAVIEMRRRMGWTQTELAAKFGCAVQTVGRWESYDPPRGRTLERLARFADKAKYTRAFDFWSLVEFEKGIERPLWFSVDSQEESLFAAALLKLLREPEWADLRPDLARVMKPVLERLEPGTRDIPQILEAIAAAAAEWRAAAEKKYGPLMGTADMKYDPKPREGKEK